MGLDGGRLCAVATPEENSQKEKKIRYTVAWKFFWGKVLCKL